MSGPARIICVLPALHGTPATFPTLLHFPSRSVADKKCEERERIISGGNSRSRWNFVREESSLLSSEEGPSEERGGGGDPREGCGMLRESGPCNSPGSLLLDSLTPPGGTRTSRLPHLYIRANNEHANRLALSSREVECASIWMQAQRGVISRSCNCCRCSGQFPPPWYEDPDKESKRLTIDCLNVMSF